VIGTPKQSDIDFVTDQKALQYLSSFAFKKRINFQEIYPGSSPESIDFMNKTIVFNPSQRMTVDEALVHPLFSKLRDKKTETLAETPITLFFEKENMDAARLRKLFVDEISLYLK